MDGFGVNVLAGTSTLEIMKAAGFTVSVTVVPAGTATVDPAPGLTTRTLTLGTLPAGDSWRVEFFTAGGSLTSLGSATGTTASSLASGISGVSGFGAAVEGSKLLITRIAGGDFSVVGSLVPTSSMAVDTTAKSRVVTISGVDASDTVTLTLTPNGGSAQVYSSTEDTDALVAGDLTTKINAMAANGFAASLSGTDITIISASGTFTADLSSGHGTVAGARDAASVTLNGTPVEGDTWLLSLDPQGAATPVDGSFLVPASPTLVGIATDLRSDLSAGAVFVVLRKSAQLFATHPGGSENFTVAASILAGGSTSQGTALTQTLTFAHEVGAGDTWSVTLTPPPGGPISITPASGASDASGVLATLRDGIHALDGYSAFSSGLVVYVSSPAAFTMTATVTRNPLAPDATTSETLKQRWSQDVLPLPAGAPTLVAQKGDTWTITIDTHDYTTAALTGGETLDGIVDALVTRLTGVSGISASNSIATVGHLTVKSSSGAVLDIGPVHQLRADAATKTSTPFTANGFQLRDAAPDAHAHFTTAVVELSGAWVAGEVWTVVVDTETFTYQVPSAAVTPQGDRTLHSIAEALIAKIDASATFDASFFDTGSTSAKILVKDHSGTDDPFALEVRRGGGTVTGLFDIDGGGVVNGSVPVLVPLPFLPFISVTDFIDYTARLSVEVLNPDGSAHPCTSVVGAIPDAGSTTTADPLLQCTFNTPTGVGSHYQIRVGSVIDWAATSRFFGVDASQVLDRSSTVSRASRAASATT